MSGGIKHDQKKIPLQLLSTTALNEIASVMAFGATKYSAHNWRKGIEWSRVLGAALRHITAFNDGQDKDPETGISHLAHAACCLMFLLEYEKTHKELDDRYKGEGISTVPVSPTERAQLQRSLEDAIDLSGSLGTPFNRR